MIYFTEIANDAKGDQSVAEMIKFQFYMKELPESIKFPMETKVNHIEYNGGFVTNQIIGVYQKEIEWEGCFFGTYSRPDGSTYSAKERADEVKKYMGRPIRVGFAVPNGSDDYIPGENEEPMRKVGKSDEKMNGIVGVYVIQEYEPEIFNYTDVSYRIKLVPHMRQEKIKPGSTEVVAIKVNVDTVAQAAARVSKAIPKGPKKQALARAAAAGTKNANTAKNMTPGSPTTSQKPILKGSTQQRSTIGRSQIR